MYGNIPAVALNIKVQPIEYYLTSDKTTQTGKDNYSLNYLTVTL